MATCKCKRRGLGATNVIDAAIRDGVEAFESVVNRGGFRTSTEIASVIGTWHRSLQQSFTRVCVAWFDHLAEVGARGPGHYDMRNEASIRLALAFQEIPARLRALPFT
jgi:hypothetical protein